MCYSASRQTWAAVVLLLSLSGACLSLNIHARALLGSHPKNSHLLGVSTELYATYKGRLAAQPSSSKKVVYVCDPHGCGGLGDRLKGFISSFILALLMDAEFCAFWELPV